MKCKVKLFLWENMSEVRNLDQSTHLNIRSCLSPLEQRPPFTVTVHPCGGVIFDVKTMIGLSQIPPVRALQMSAGLSVKTISFLLPLAVST